MSVILNRVEIIHEKVGEIIAKVPLRLTEAKLEVLVEVAKAWEMDLSELVEAAIDQDIRCQLEGCRVSNPTNVGERLNKVLCDIWLKEIGEDQKGPEEIDQRSND
jgi:hypothetical protein